MHGTTSDVKERLRFTKLAFSQISAGNNDTVTNEANGTVDAVASDLTNSKSLVRVAIEWLSKGIKGKGSGFGFVRIYDKDVI